MMVFEIDPLCDLRWQVLVDSSARSSVFHRVEWLRALKSGYGYEPVVFSLCPPGSPLTNALVFCRVRSALTGKRLVSLPFSDHCEPIVERQEEAEALIAYVCSCLKTKKWKYAELRPISVDPWEQVIPGASSTYFLHCIDLLRSEEDLFKSLHKDSVQRKIRKANRESLRYLEGTSDSHLEQFYRLMVQTRRRHHLPPQPLKWFRSLIENFGKDLKIRTALKGDIPVASILTLSHGKTMTYKYGCSDVRFQNLGGTALLFWNTMIEARTGGLERFDLGRSDSSDKGLVVFKEHWGAVRTTLCYRRIPFHTVAPEERSWTRWVVKHLVSAAPDSVLIACGKVLYRHVG